MTPPAIPLFDLLSEFPGQIGLLPLPQPSGSERLAARNPLITGLTSDSREVRPGDLFLALAGHHEHGLAYFAQARARGAVALAFEPDPRCRLPASDIPTVAVPELSRRVGHLAGHFFGWPAHALNLIGITGTDGKTSVAQFLAQALHSEHERCASIGTLGYGHPGALRSTRLTTPDPISLHRILSELKYAKTQRVVMEVSSHALAQDRVAGIPFNHAILTNLSRDHLDYHGDMDAYAAAKARLFHFPGLRTAILNTDDAFGRQLASQVAAERIIAYGFSRPPRPIERYVYGHDLVALPNRLQLKVSTWRGDASLNANLLGEFNACNLLAVLATLLAEGIALADACERIARLTSVPGRMQPVYYNTNSPLVVVDYAHTPAALAHAITALRQHCTGRLHCIFGCGGERDRGKRPLMGETATRLADQVYITDDNPRNEASEQIVSDILSGIDTNRHLTEVIHDRALAIRRAILQANPNDIILIAGKGHENVQVVGQNRIPFDDCALARTILTQRQGQAA